MRMLYLECYSGAAGDMLLGALIDLGVPIEEIRRAVGSLELDAPLELRADRVLRAGVSATKFRLVAPAPAGAHHHHPHGPRDHVHAAPDDAHESEHPGEPPRESRGERGEAHDHAHGHRGLSEIRRLVEGAALSAAARDRAMALFTRLAEAEAAIHDVPVERVHLHEVGALDSIVDIVGCVVALEWLGVDEIVASPLNTGHGTVRCAHGVFPVPAPATARLLAGVPVYAEGPAVELLTPTGALVVTGFATRYGPLPPMTIERVGYGAGDRDLAGRPNVVRALLGTSAEEGPAERLLVMTCEIDDMNPQLYGPLMERLYAVGALEVYYQGVQMKKNRPGTLITVLVEPTGRAAVADTLFRETTTLGVRYHEVRRDRLEREVVEVATRFGVVRAKLARRDGRVLNAMPEFDDCARLAAGLGLPVKDVQAAASAACQTLIETTRA